MYPRIFKRYFVLPIVKFIFLLFSVSVLLIGFDSYVHAETTMKLNNDKYVIVHEYGFPSMSSDDTTIEIFGTFANSNLDSFKISSHVSSFTLSEKPPMSLAPVTISKDLVSIDDDLTDIFTSDESSRSFTISINEEKLPYTWPSGKYVGKIFLSYENETLVIPIEIVMKTSPFMLLFFSLIGLGIIFVYNLIHNRVKHKHGSVFIIITVIGMITIPASLFASTTYVGIVLLDSVVAFGVGIFAYVIIHTRLGELLGLLKPEESILKQIRDLLKENLDSNKDQVKRI